MSQFLIQVVKDKSTPAGDEPKVYKAIASTDAIDRDHEILIPKGIQLENFLKNPVMLFIHNSRQIPVGKVTNIDVSDEAVTFEFVFAETDVAQDIRKQYDDGFMSAFSVGFYPKHYLWINEDTPEKIELTTKNGSKWLLDLTRYKERPRTIIIDWELLEISPVPIPSNPEALLIRSLEQAISKNMSGHPFGAKLIHDRFDPVVNSILKTVKDFIKSTEDYEVSGAIPIHECPVDKESAWDRIKALGTLAKRASSDGSGAKNTLDWGKYAEGFGWVNPEKAQELISYKLPHHFVNSEGELVVNLNAVRDSMSKLLSEGRGGIFKTDSDVKQVYEHLVKHYIDAGEEFPEFKLDFTDEELKSISSGDFNQSPKAVEVTSKQENVDSLNEVRTAIKELSNLVLEGNEALSLRMSILLDTLDEVSQNVQKQQVVTTLEETTLSEVDPKEEMSLDLKQVSDLLQAFTVASV